MGTVADGITADPEHCGGRPCVRGMRIRVIDVLDLLASGLPPHLKEGVPVAESEEYRPGLILDYDAQGDLLSLEILDASRGITDAHKIEDQP